MQFYTAADVVGAGAAVQLSTLFSQTSAKELLFSIVSGSAGCRFGDSNVTAGRGLLINASIAPTVLRTTVADVVDKFDMTKHYVYVPVGVTLSLAIGC